MESRAALLGVLFALSSGLTAQEHVPPGIQRGSAPLVSPHQARAILAGAGEDAALGSETAITPEIEELARGLRYDPQLIYEYVRNSIDYVAIYGSLKGATMTMHDRRGNDFDQTSLLIALMRESGYTASFIHGMVQLDAATISNLLGVDSDPNVVGSLLGSAGIPATVFVNGMGNLVFVRLDHVWAKVNISGTDYVFDPSVKGYLETSGIDLATAMGYDQATFLASANSGSTIDPDFVQNINHNNIHSDFTTYSTNLVNQVRSMNGATLADVVGGRQIVEQRGAAFVTTLPYELSRDFEWTDVPSTHQTRLRIQHLGIDEDLSTPEVYGKRLTLTYNGSNAPELKIDGVIKATGSSVSPGSSNSITLTADHAYAAFGGTYGDQSSSRTIQEGSTYVIVNGWGETGRSIVDEHKRIATENIEAGNPNTSEPVLGETLTIVALTWLGEATAAVNIADAVGDTTTIQHHTVGFCGQDQSPSIDLPLGFSSVISNVGDSSAEDAGFFVGSGIASALEWGVFDQLQPVSAVCTVKLVDISSGKGDKVFSATTANYNAVVLPQLTGYSAFELATVAAYINAGFRVILPQDGNLGEGNWSGIGFLAVSPGESQIAHIIAGGLKGGVGIFAGIADALFAAAAGIFGLEPGQHPWSFDPIDLFTGDYLHHTTDLALGSGPAPFQLELSRAYNSGARHTVGALGRGWSHNHSFTAQGADSDGFKGLGEESPLDAAPAIVELFVALDLLDGPKTTERLVIATVAHRWFMDRLIDNVVVFSHGGNAQRFLQLPDGTFQAPVGSADVLNVEVDGSYRIQQKDGVVIDFDTSDNIESWTDPNGNQVTYSYSSGVLQTVSTSMGRTLNFTYTGNHLTQVSDNAGRSVGFQYDASDNLTVFTDALLNETTYVYDDPGRITEVFYPADPLDAFVTNTYDQLNRVATQTNAHGDAHDYHYAGVRTEEEDPLGNTKVWYFNRRGKAELEIDALGNETSHSYDGHLRLTGSTFPELNAIDREYDEQHNLTRVAITPKPSSGQSSVEKLYTYESSFNQLDTMTDALGRVTDYDYDASGNVITITRPVGGLNPVSTYTYNSRGQVLTETDPESMVTRYTYDAGTGDLLSIVLDDGGLALTNQMVYDTAGSITHRIDPLGATTTYTHDASRRIDQITSPSPFNHVRNFDYDENGNLTRDERETGIAATPWQTTDFTYTLSGKKASRIDPEGNVTTFEYDALDRLWRITDANLHQTSFTYDARGNQFQLIDALGNVEEEYAWHLNGQQQSTKDANGNVTSLVYDGFDKLSRQVFPDTSYEEYAYDAVGNLLQKRVRSGVQITYTYDELDRLDSKSMPGVGANSVQYVYDRLGRLVDVTDNSGTTHHDYDTAGRLSMVTHPSGRTVKSKYDAASRRTRLTYPDAYSVDYQYDALGRLRNLRENGRTTLARYDYDALDRRVGVTYGNGTATTYAYEIDDNVTAIDHALNGSAVSVGYTYDLVGNRVTRTDDSRTHTYTYDDIDRLTSVQQPGDDVAYVYDDVGNRLSKTVGAVTETYAPNSLNQYSSVNGRSYTYDANGNLTKRDTRSGTETYTYDADNKLLAFSGVRHVAEYGYDAFKRRTTAKVTSKVGPRRLPFMPLLAPPTVVPISPLGATHTRYVYDGNQVIMEIDESTGMLLRRFVYGTYVDEPVVMKTAAGDLTYHSDALGSIVAISDGAGAPAGSHTYTPFGTVDTDGSRGNPYLFTGRRCDVESGLYYYRSRYYDARIGRFLSPDPLGLAAGTNLYAYTANNPVMFVDPLGLDWLTNLSNFSAGFGDSLTFGLTGVVRQWMGTDHVVDRGSGYYQAGEYTEVAVEVTLTLGSAALKQTAKHASRKAVRNEFRRRTKDIARNGKQLHHNNPLFGHPGNIPTLFPTGGLPGWIHSSRLNLRLLGPSHTAVHRRLRFLERWGSRAVNPLMTGGRLARNLLSDFFNRK